MNDLNPSFHRTRLRPVVVAVAALVVLTAAAGVAGAHDARATDEHGDLSATPDPATCSVLFEATGVDAGGVFLEVYRPSAGAPELVTREFAQGGPEGPPSADRTFAFQERIELTENEAQFADRILMVFDEVTEGGERVRHTAVVFFEPFDCQVGEGVTVPDCPADVRAVARGDRDNPFIHLEWDAVVNADGYRVYRNDGSGFRLLLQQDPRFGTTFNDRDVEPGVTYAYRVTAFNDAGESGGCPVVEATAIPFFPAPILGALALVGSVGAYVWVTRRRS